MRDDTDKGIFADRLNQSVSLFNHMLFGYDFGHYNDIDFRAYNPPGREIEAPWNATFRNRDLSEVSFLTINVSNQLYWFRTENELGVDSTMKNEMPCSCNSLIASFRPVPLREPVATIMLSPAVNLSPRRRRQSKRRRK